MSTSKTTKRGRPKTATAEKHATSIQLAPDELDLIERAAQQEGRSRTNYIVRAALAKAREDLGEGRE